MKDHQLKENKTIQDFINDVKTNLGHENEIFGYCPVCYCTGMISGSHRCLPEWEQAFNQGQDYEKRVKQCTEFMKKFKFNPIII